MQHSFWRSVLVVFALGGCAARPASSQNSPAAPRERPVPTTSPAMTLDPKAKLTLDEIEPRPTFPKSRPDTQQSEPPLESLRIFARARLASLDGDRGQAAALLERALGLDPESFELHKSLGDLYASAGDARARGQWEQAAAIDPDHVDLQIGLGRLAMEDGDLAGAMNHLRLAQLTSAYRRGDPADGEADFLLARVLQDQGYDRAALQMYERLLVRLRAAQFAARTNRQIAALLAHPGVLALHVAALYEKNHSFAPALSLLRSMTARGANDFELQARIVRDEAAAGEVAEASKDAAELVARFHADSKSVALLSEIAGPNAVGLLRKLHESDPVDRDITYALADVLTTRGLRADAVKVLAEAARRWPDDPRLLGRRMDLLRAQGNFKGAARLAIDAFSRRPDHAIELAPLWDALSHASPQGKLRVADVQTLSVPPVDEPARLVLLARLAGSGHRDALQRDALARATAARPLFAPAFRDMLSLIWSDEGRTKEQRINASGDLAGAAENAGDGGLAAELRGQALLDGGDTRAASAEFSSAAKAGDRSPELSINLAAALHATRDDRGAQSLLWKVISDRPLADGAYEELYAIYQMGQEPQRAQGVLTVWLTADPDSVAAQQVRVREAIASRRFTDAEHILLDLLSRHDTDPQVLASLLQFYSETGRLNELIPIFRKRLDAEHWNTTLATALSEAYEQAHQKDDALKILDDLHDAVSHDPEALYSLAGTYSRLSATDRSEKTLSELLTLDPGFAGANNDLGYTWADQGRNLRQARELVAKALAVEPDNPSFLDSMGWVLYKLGRFDEAVKNLQRAAVGEEPVVLDHLGDALYRLGDHDKAVAAWERAAAAIGEPREDERDDVKQLRQKLKQKQQQVAGGKTASVAPVAEER